MGASRSAIVSQLQSWCDALATAVVGRVTLSNLRHEYRSGRLSGSTVSAFLWDVARTWARLNPKRRAGGRPPRPDEVWQSVAKARILSGPLVVPGSERCSRVVCAADFVSNNVDPMECIGISAFPTKKELAYLKYRWPKGGAYGTMPQARPFAWVTQTGALDPIRTRPDAAHQARIALGLLHYRGDERLLEILYPKGLFGAGDLRVPTCFEGCPSMVFRASTAADGWGRAVNLENLKDGAPEAVHGPVPFDSAFEFEDLGVLPPLALDPVLWESWDSLLSTFPDPWTSACFDEVAAYV